MRLAPVEYVIRHTIGDDDKSIHDGGENWRLCV